MHVKARVSDHQGISPKTGTPVKSTLLTSVVDNMLISDHQVVWEDFRKLGSESSKY